ncbi:hypothetical protein DXG01_012798 [Tephrocybe rancida]|nr:hypothetical protein DXG01_012798 [Tephrocybe rancida]
MHPAAIVRLVIPPTTIYWSLAYVASTFVIIITTIFALSPKGSPRHGSKLHLIPAIGPTARLMSYFGALRFLFDGSRMIQDGYEKYTHGIFRIADFRSWTIIVSGPQLIDEVRKAPEDVLAFEAAIDDTQLTREMNDSFYDIRDEVIAAFSELVPVAPGSDWSTFPAWDNILDIVSQTTHRMFVGLPLCRDPGYRKMNKQFATEISRAASLVRLFPSPLKWLIGRPFVDVPAALECCVNHLRPTVEGRRKNIERHGRNYAGKPQDLLSWFMDEVDGQSDEEKLKHIAFHFLIVNFGSVYTISTSFTQALYHLAAHPEYVAPLREEIEAVTASEGWTKAAMGEMRKLDSFLKESQRISGLGAVASYRRVLKPFTFSNGVCIPAGTTIGVATWSTHLDDSVYSDAQTFDAMRYVHEESQLVTPTTNFLAFGLGRHLCPGRFFAVIILKTMMAHVLMNYDIKLEKDGVRPKDSWFVTDNIPNSTANLFFRKRVQ